MTALALTAAGRAAVADAEYVGTEAIEITHLAVGDGLRPGGADDDARTALRSERDREAVAGQTAIAGHVACVADWTPAASYAATEVGLIATIDGASVLLAYWAAESAAEAAFRAAAGTRLLLACDVAIASAAADLAVTLTPQLTFAAVPDATTAISGISRRATGAEVQAAAEADEDGDRAALERAAHVTPYDAARLAISLRRSLADAVVDATTAVKGISRRATGDEVQAAAEADEEADRAALEGAAHLTPREAARIPIAIRGGALPGNRANLKQLADALAAVERRLEEGLDVRIAVFQSIPGNNQSGMVFCGGNLQGAGAPGVHKHINLPGGTYEVEVQMWGRVPQPLFIADGYGLARLADIDVATYRLARGVVTAPGAVSWTFHNGTQASLAVSWYTNGRRPAGNDAAHKIVRVRRLAAIG